MKIQRAVLVSGASMMAVLFGLASVAWACTTQSTIDPLAVPAAPAGAKVPVTGVASKSGPVEIRWNGLNGPVVGTGEPGGGGVFAVEVTVPEAAPGMYYLVLVDENNNVGPAAFEVTPSAVGAPAGSRPSSAWAEAAEAPSSARDVGLLAGIALLGLGLGLVAMAAALAIIVRSGRPAGC